jgi:hypothetical protein
VLQQSDCTQHKRPHDLHATMATHLLVTSVMVAAPAAPAPASCISRPNQWASFVACSDGSTGHASNTKDEGGGGGHTQQHAPAGTRLCGGGDDEELLGAQPRHGHIRFDAATFVTHLRVHQATGGDVDVVGTCARQESGCAWSNDAQLRKRRDISNAYCLRAAAGKESVASMKKDGGWERVVVAAQHPAYRGQDHYRHAPSHLPHSEVLRSDTRQPRGRAKRVARIIGAKIIGALEVVVAVARAQGKVAARVERPWGE